MFKKMVKIVPVKDKRTLELTWILSDQSMNYRNSPSKYVSHILGHEGKGSLLSYLIA
jgi:insulysin